MRIPSPAGRRAARAAAAALTAALSASSSAAAENATTAPSAATVPAAATVVLPTTDATRLRALECTSGRETGSFPLARQAPAVVALAPDGDAAFVAQQRQLLRLSLPALGVQARGTLAVDAITLAASGDADATVLVAGSGGAPFMQAHDARSLALSYEYGPENGRSASVSSIVDRPQRSRFVVAFSDLDEVWEIDYGRDAPPVLKGLVHDYRMREAVELPGRFTPRAFKVPGATRALVAGALAHEALRIDASGALGVLNLDVRREIERPAFDASPAPERIAAWRGTHSRGWVLADGATSTLRVLDSGSWGFAEPLQLDGEVLALSALPDGIVLVALGRRDAISLVRLDVERRRTDEVARQAARGTAPYRLVPGTDDCRALVDAGNRWIAGVARTEKRRGS